MGGVEEKFLNEINRRLVAKSSSTRILKPLQPLKPTFDRAVLMFSDQQVVTGIGLLASGYAQLHRGIESYHWQMLVYLAWFSSVTHLATLTALRQYFRTNHAARLWKAVLMLVTVVMLGIALLPTGDALWIRTEGGMRGVPALCYFRRLVSQNPNDKFIVDTVIESIIISLLVLFSGYMTRLVKLSDKATIASRLWLRAKPAQRLKSIQRYILHRTAKPGAGCFWSLMFVAIETMYILLRISFDIYESMLWAVRICPRVAFHLVHVQTLADTNN